MNFDKTFKVMISIAATYVAAVSVTILTVVGLAVFITLKYFGVI